MKTYKSNRHEKKPSKCSFDSLLPEVVPGAIILIGLVLFFNRPQTRADTFDNGQRQPSLVELDIRHLSNALRGEGCELKGKELRCDEETMNLVMQDVDTTSVNVKGNKIILKQNGSYVSMPATMIANMIDHNLVNTMPREE